MKILVLTLFSLCNLALGQLKKKDLYGHWKVTKTIKNALKPELRGILEGFKNATFSFANDHDFDLSTESKAPTFQMLLQLTKDAKWQFDESEQRILIGSEENGYSIMGITPTASEKGMLFSLDESTMVFVVERIP